MRTWLSTEPSEYFVSSRGAAASTASEIAIPRLPVESGCSARIVAAGVRLLRRARDDPRAERLDQPAPIRLLVVGDPAPSTRRPRGRRSRPRTRAPSPTARRPSPSRGASRPLACCSTPARPPYSACASRSARRPRTCSRCAPASRAQPRDAARGRAASAATAGRPSATSSGIAMSRSVETSCRMICIGKSGARSSGPTGSPVPGWRRAEAAPEIGGEVVPGLRQPGLVEDVLHLIGHCAPSFSWRRR